VNDEGLTKAVADELVAAVQEMNLPRKFAATFCGVSPKTFDRWLSLGATGAGSALHIDLARRIYEAEGRKVGGAMTALQLMAEADPKAAEAFLKMFKPGDFGGVKPEPDEFDGAERNAQKRAHILDAPSPRLLAEFGAKGFWKFPAEIDDEDRATLIAIQNKYQVSLALPEKAQ
jgi:hypothetical protein